MQPASKQIWKAFGIESHDRYTAPRPHPGLNADFKFGNDAVGKVGLRSGKINRMDAEEKTSAALDALNGLTMRPELVAWWKVGADLAEQYRADTLKLQKRRTALARRTASVKSALRSEERKIGAAVVRLLKTDVELRVVLLPKLLAAAKPEDKAALEQFLAASPNPAR